jgi:hypothetical protein
MDGGGHERELVQGARGWACLRKDILISRLRELIR